MVLSSKHGASSIKTKLNEYLSNVPVEYDEYKEEIVYNQSCIELGNTHLI